VAYRLGIEPMDVIKRQKFCDTCNKLVMAERPTGMSDGMGCLISLFTGGLFLPVFIALRCINALGSFRCTTCGSKAK
jgi:hypothetical protein